MCYRIPTTKQSGGRVYWPGISGINLSRPATIIVEVATIEKL